MITVELEIEAKDAEHIAEALNVDNEGYPIETFGRDGKIICRMSGEDCGTLKNVADDILACIAAMGG